ncbi:MAG: TIGR00341 family protein [Candidatus Nanosalina sp.]
MKQIQVDVPEENEDEARKIIAEYSSDVYTVEGERDGDDVTVFNATIKSEDFDEIVSQLKSIKEIELGDLAIRVLEEQSLVQKGQKTRGSSTMLSQEEIYSKAQESATFSQPQWALIALSSAIAAYGLMLDNIAVVIGAMMLAPILSPLVSGAIALSIGDRSLLKNSFFTSFLAVPVSIFFAAISIAPFSPSINPTMNLIVSAGVPNMILSLFVGAAAALAFVTGLRDQIAGVAVAIALVPPLAATGVGLRMYDFVFATRAASIAVVNLLAVLVSGSLSLKALGVEPSTYYKKKSAEQLKFVFPAAISLMLLTMIFLLFGPL